MEMLELFLSFFKIGFLAFGGGWSIVGVIGHEVVEKGWLTSTDFSQIVSVSQLTPGPVAVNVATYVGFKVCGIWGSAVSTLGILIPPLIVIIIAQIVSKFVKFDEKRFNVALRTVSASLILVTLYTLAGSSNGNLITLTLAVVSFLLFIKTDVDPVYIIIASAFLGALIYTL